MEIKWLEDFISLADTQSFSRSARERNITQPAFSRRIRALESWLSVELIDRSIYPTRLTPAGRLFREKANELLRDLNDARALLRRDERAETMLHVTAAHTLAIAYYPKWIAGLMRKLGDLSTHLEATNIHDAVLALVEGDCDLLLCYNHPRLPVLLDPNRYASVLVGHEPLLPVSVPSPHGRPLHALPGRRSHPVPLVAYSPNSYLGRAVELILQERGKKLYVTRRVTTEMSEAVKALVLEGIGFAWLPESAINRELTDGRLVRCYEHGNVLQLELRFYRALDNRKRDLEDVWRYLTQESPGSSASARNRTFAS
jgi:DNA-binding transcriptional LysR family regulator